MYGEFKGYDNLMSVAHRRTVGPLSAPALVCHLAFRYWEVPPASGDSQAPASARQENIGKLIRNVNAWLDAIDRQHPDASKSKYRFCLTRPERNEINSPTFLFPSETLASSLCRFGPFHVEVNIEIQTEFVSFTFMAAPVERAPVVAPGRGNIQIANDALNCLAQLYRGDSVDDHGADDSIATLYDKFWDAFFREFNIETFREVGKREKDDEAWVPGDKFAEFLGVVMRTPFDLKERARPSRSGDRANKSTDDPLADQVAMNAKRWDHQPAFPGGNFIELRDDDDAAVVRRNVMDFVDARPTWISRVMGFRLDARSGHRPFFGGNAVLSLMQNGAAMYGSTLDIAPAGHTRLRYVLVYGGPSRHQLGRLVHRLHDSGQLRLAALFDYEQILEASDLIQDLDALISGPSREPFGKRAPDTGAAPDLERRALKQINEISRLGRGGLTYRIARSAYYVSTLKSRLDDLHVETVHGWQPYDGFLHRTVFRHFENIVGVGERQQAVQTQIRRLMNDSIARSIDEQTGKTLKLHRLGEIFAAATLVYYFGHIFDILLEWGLVTFQGFFLRFCIAGNVMCTPSSDYAGVLRKACVFGICLLFFAAYFVLSANETKKKSGGKLKP